MNYEVKIFNHEIEIVKPVVKSDDVSITFRMTYPDVHT